MNTRKGTYNSKFLATFIIPAYNASGTIIRCLKSIYTLALKPDEFEVIVIDDCSTDDTVAVIEQFANGHANLSLLRQFENHRQGAARNKGVRVAKGEYICFVDADDAVSSGIVKAIRLSTETKADMTAMHFACTNEHGVITSEAQPISFAEGAIFTGVDMQIMCPYWCSAPWGFLYRRAFLDRVNYQFAEDVLYEDSDFVAVHLYHAERMTYSCELGYKAYYREGSTTRHTSYKNVADYLFLGVRMLRFYKEIFDNEEFNRNRDHQKFSDGILEGACWNIQKSTQKIIKLSGLEEAKAYYKRVDMVANREELCEDNLLRKYYWNAWTRICLGNKKLTLSILVLAMPIYKITQSLKGNKSI